MILRYLCTIVLCPFPLIAAAESGFDINRWQSWNNVTPNVFACAFEKKTGKSYPPYSCAKAEEERKNAHVVPDPCTLSDYYAGPWSQGCAEGELPKQIAQLVHKDAIGGTATWNAGFLQNITVTLAKDYASETEALSGVVGPLPDKNQQMQITFGPKCDPKHACLDIDFHDFQDLSGFRCGEE